MANKKEVRLTQSGLDAVMKELNQLRENDRPRIIQAIKDARAQGDLSENADYDAARDDQAKCEARIKELEYMVEHAVIIENAPAGVAGLGSKVTIDDDGDEDTYEIVGSLEADPFENKISDESPIGKALCGAKVGDIVSVPSPKGSYDVKIVRID